MSTRKGKNPHAPSFALTKDEFDARKGPFLTLRYEGGVYAYEMWNKSDIDDNLTSGGVIQGSSAGGKYWKDDAFSIHVNKANLRALVDWLSARDEPGAEALIDMLYMRFPLAFVAYTPYLKPGRKVIIFIMRDDAN